METAGYVYLLKSPTTNYKIGRTKNPDDRLRTFTVKLPFEVEYDHLIKCSDMYRAEAILHGRFNRKRVNGEWFNLTDAEVFFVKRLERQEHIEALTGDTFIYYWENAMNDDVRRENKCPKCLEYTIFSFPLPASPAVWTMENGQVREHVGFYCPSCKFKHSGSRLKRDE